MIKRLSLPDSALSLSLRKRRNIRRGIILLFIYFIYTCMHYTYYYVLHYGRAVTSIASHVYRLFVADREKMHHYVFHRRLLYFIVVSATSQNKFFLPRFYGHSRQRRGGIAAFFLFFLFARVRQQWRTRT